MKKFGISQSVKRVEDIRLLKGEGQFVDDLSPADSTVMVFYRSPVAHAKISKIDIGCRLCGKNVCEHIENKTELASLFDPNIRYNGLFEFNN